VVIGDQRNESTKRPALGIPRLEDLPLVLEEREEHLLGEVLDLLRHVSSTTAATAPSNERLRDAPVDDRADRANERANGLRILRDGACDEVLHLDRRQRLTRELFAASLVITEPSRTGRW
jgi:hypothetical protein